MALLISHAVSLGDDRDDWHHLADAGHELQVARLQLVWADEVDACIIHVLELELLKQNALSLIALVDVLLPDQGQDFTDISITVFICHVITIPVKQTHVHTSDLPIMSVSNVAATVVRLVHRDGLWGTTMERSMPGLCRRGMSSNKLLTACYVNIAKYGSEGQAHDPVNTMDMATVARHILLEQLTVCDMLLCN